MGDTLKRAEERHAREMRRVTVALYPERCRLAYLSVLALMDWRN